jgi:hypothetical protein
MVKSKLRGLRNYFGVTGNSACVRRLDEIFRRTLYGWLNRRSERKSYMWPTFVRIWDQFNVSSRRDLYDERYQESLLAYLRQKQHEQRVARRARCHNSAHRDLWRGWWATASPTLILQFLGQFF